MRMNVDDMDYKQLKMLLNNHYFDGDLINDLFVNVLHNKLNKF
jgi:hypothetical protein